ncbi:MAG: hypothetical protein N2482_01810 [Patescibacteria group bacterium]|nr:hypothetical protein [Patescibacteria group bacterium]
MKNGCEGCVHLITPEETVERYGENGAFEILAEKYKKIYGDLLVGFCGLANSKHPRMCLCKETYQQATCPKRIEYSARNN